MRKIGFVMIGLFGILNAQFPDKDFEIVESYPLETKLDNPDIRNTKDVWLELFKNAKKTIDIEQFYISNDSSQALAPVIDAILEAAKRGVKVRIIIDYKMGRIYPESLKLFENQENILIVKTKIFHYQGGVQHSKFFIIDNELVFIGSQNFDWRALDHIHEIGVKIRHEKFAMHMTKLFDFDWQQAVSNIREETFIPVGYSTYTINSKTAGEIKFHATASPYRLQPVAFYPDEKAIIEAIHEAEKSICIQLLSYSPSRKYSYYAELDNAIRQAAARKVKVKLLVSDWCQKSYEMPFLKSLQVIPNIEVKLTTIPEFSEGYIPFARVEHCKFMVVDDKYCWIGTSNWKESYFYVSRNVAVVIENQMTAGRMKEVFNKSWNSEYAWLVEPCKDYIPKKYGEKD